MPESGDIYPRAFTSIQIGLTARIIQGGGDPLDGSVSGILCEFQFIKYV
jgi:hypothetical protein